MPFFTRRFKVSISGAFLLLVVFTVFFSAGDGGSTFNSEKLPFSYTSIEESPAALPVIHDPLVKLLPVMWAVECLLARIDLPATSFTKSLFVNAYSRSCFYFHITINAP